MTSFATPADAADLQDDVALRDFVSRFDHHSPFFRDRHRDVLRYMLAHSPVTWTEAHGGFWVFTRYEDVCRIAKDDETFSSEDGIILPKPLSDIRSLPIEKDAPAHLFYRVPLNAAFTPGKMRELKLELRALADELIAAKQPQGGLDIVLDLAQPLAGIITMRLLGVPEEDWHAYAGPIHDATFGNGTPEERMAAIIDYGTRVAADVRNPDYRKTGGIIQRLHEHESRGRSFSIDEIQSMVSLVYIGGLDTAQAAVGTFAVHLARNPALRARLAADPSLMPRAVEEFLRVMAPQQALARTATRDVEVGGATIRKGQKVLMLWAAANFDSSKFGCPFDVDIERTDNRHLTFGIGAHTCLGAPLARVEIQAALEALLAAAPDYRLIEEQMEFAEDVGVVFGYNKLPIRFDAA
ncbi:cytochrome P450 [Sphingomonas sp. CJ20]